MSQVAYMLSDAMRCARVLQGGKRHMVVDVGLTVCKSAKSGQLSSVDNGRCIDRDGQREIHRRLHKAGCTVPCSNRSMRLRHPQAMNQPANPPAASAFGRGQLVTDLINKVGLFNSGGKQ